MSLLPVVATFLAVLVGFFAIFLIKFLDIMIVPRSFHFFFMLSSKMKELDDNTMVLRAIKEDINQIIVRDGRNSRSPGGEVKIWMEDVDAIEAEIQTLVDDYMSMWRHDGGISSIYSKYLVGMKCADKLKKVKDLLKRRPFDPLTVESYSPPSIPTPYEVPGPLEPNYAKALEYVQNDNSSNIIGIWGMGGVGKTTLLKKIHNSCIELSRFDLVIWVSASREIITHQKVQRQIAQKLRLKESDEPQLQANIIFIFLRNKNFLLFIDDLWEMIDLELVGVPNPSDNRCGNKRKVVFTTRLKSVCGRMEAKKIIKIDCLDDEKSWVLFKEKVGEQVIQSHPRISALAVEVAKECKGLPLALMTVGRAMATKITFHEWEYHLYQMRKSRIHTFPGAGGEMMLQILKISYDSLAADTLRQCFLSISMWPEEHCICKNELIECWMGLDIIDDFESMAEAYLIGFSLIGNLQDACLLEDGEKNLCFTDGREYVKMHPILRDLALWIASNCGEHKNKWIVKAGFQLEEVSSIKVKWEEAERISLMHNQLTELPLGISDCPDLLTLMLQRNNLTCKSVLNCFANFHLLEYLDLCANKLNGFPESIYALTVLRYLNLSFNHIENIPEKIKELEKLKYLILRENPISDIPKNVLSKLVNLLVLDLFCAESSSYVLCADDLRCLEKTLLYLGITIRTHEDLNEISLLSHLRVGALSIQGLHDRFFHFMSMIQNLYCLKELNIQHSLDGLEEIVFDKNCNHQNISSLHLETLTFEHLCKLKMISWKEIRAENLFVELRVIRVFECELLEDITWVIHLPSLLTLDITGCKSMRIVISDAANTFEVDPNVLTFPSLKRLTLVNMEKLERFSNRSIAIPQLEKLQVTGCPLLKVNEIGGISIEHALFKQS